MANQWFRMYSEFANDPKVQRLSETDQRRYVMLLCLRCSNDDVTLHDEDVAFQLRISETDWAATKATLIERKLIGDVNNPSAWDKRQFASDSSTARVAKHREAKKRGGNDDVTLHDEQGNAPDTDTDTDTDTEQKQSKSKSLSSPSASTNKNSLAMLVSLDVPEQIAKDWLAVRKAKRAPLTETVLEELKLEAGKAGITVAEAVAISAKNSWQGFKATWLNKQGVVNGKSSVFEQTMDAGARAKAKLFGDGVPHEAN